MRPTPRILIIALFAMVCIAPTVYSQEDMREIDNQVFPNPRRPPAVFAHDEHNERAEIYECQTCHHVYGEDGELLKDESSEDQRCSDCHELEQKGSKPSLEKAFHLNCKGCHKMRRSGPAMCGECHPKH